MNVAERMLRRCTFAPPLSAAALAFSALLATVLPARAASQATTGTLAGFVRDSAGAPIANAEVVLVQTGVELRRIIADEGGHFVLGNVSPGIYVAWIRRMGFASAEYNWAAVVDKRDSVTATLRTIPHGLDAVVVRAKEDKDMKGSAQILGLVVDTEGKPVAEANVELVGADRAGETLENGGFLFRPLPVGPYVVRVRKLGYVPQSVTMQLQQGEEREMVVRMHPLTGNLATVKIVAASGFDSRAEVALKDLDTRLRWRSARDVVLGPNELMRFKGQSLNWVNSAFGMTQRATFRSRGVRSINPAGTSGKVGAQTLGAEGDACILENGTHFVRQPLWSYNMSDIELLEIYDTYGDDSRTVDFHMTGRCMRGADGTHPIWYVVWLKGRDR